MHKERPRGKPRGIRRDRDCRLCKARGVKCDLNRPRCQPCVQAGLACGYSQRVVWAGERRKKSSSSASASAGSVIACSANNPYSFLRRLTAFYEQVQSTASKNPSDKAGQLVSRVWDFVLARIHRSRSSHADTDAVRSHVAALMGLNEAIQEAHPMALFGIATFAFFEVCEGPFGQWQCHLSGARSLLDLHCRCRADLDRLAQQIAGLTEIVAHLVWFDAMGAIIRGSRGLIFDDWHRETTLTESFFAVVGCPADTFALFVALARLQPDMSPLELSLRAMDQLLQLQAHPDDATERGQTANAWRCAAVIAVLGRIRIEDDSYSQTQTRRKTLAAVVDRACQAIASIPPSSGFYVHLAATAYLAGLNATTPAQCDVIRTYWRNCRSGALPYYPDGLERCEERWRAEELA